jgi:hypothetical protein
MINFRKLATSLALGIGAFSIATMSNFQFNKISMQEKTNITAIEYNFGVKPALAKGNEGSAAVGSAIIGIWLEETYVGLFKAERLFVSLEEDHESWEDVERKCKQQAGRLEWHNNEKTCYKQR